jgi:peptidoglycan/LPS O-acetylase OafA/YrhL
MFYLSLPFLGWFAARRRRLPILFGLAALAGFLLYRVPIEGIVKKAITEQVPPYLEFVAYTFSVGIATATVKVSFNLKSWARGKLANATSLVLFAITLFFAKPEFGWAESLLLAVPFACICFGNTWFGLLSSSPVRFLGRISYSFYLLHVVLMTIEAAIVKRYMSLATLAPVQYWLLAAVSGAIAIFVSAITYQYLEFPFLHVGKKRKTTQILETELTEKEA